MSSFLFVVLLKTMSQDTQTGPAFIPSLQMVNNNNQQGYILETSQVWIEYSQDYKMMQAQRHSLPFPRCHSTFHLS